MVDSSKGNVFKYSPDNMDYAISISKKLNIDELKLGISSAKKACPSSFDSSTFINIMADIETLTNNTAGITGAIEEMKNSAEGYIKTMSSSTDLYTAGTYELTIKGDQRGFLYIPNGYENSTADLPLIVDLGGYYEMSSDNRPNEKRTGFPYAINVCKQNINAIVWTPISNSDKSWAEVSNQSKAIETEYYSRALSKSSDGKVYSTIVACEALIDEYKLDNNRVSIIGYSAGAMGVFEYLKSYPNYFSTAVTWGGYVNTNNIEVDRKLIAESGTAITMFVGTKDPGAYSHIQGDYDGIKSNGGQVALYYVEGATHGDANIILNDKLVNDMIGIEKGQEVVMPSGPIYVRKEVMENSAYKKENDANLISAQLENPNFSNNWYAQLRPFETKSVTLEQLDFVPPTEKL